MRLAELQLGGLMAGKGTNPKKDQKRGNQGTARDGQTNQHRGRGDTRSVGSHQPGGDGPSKKKWNHEHDDRETRK